MEISSILGVVGADAAATGRAGPVAVMRTTRSDAAPGAGCEIIIESFQRALQKGWGAVKGSLSLPPWRI